MMTQSYQYPASYQPSAGFVPGEFFGHEKELEVVFNCLRNGQSVCLTGLRRVGRTWFLKHLTYAVRNEDEMARGVLVPAKPLDMQGLSHFAPDEIAGKIVQGVQSAIRARGWIGNVSARFGENNWSGLADAFEFFTPILEEHDQKMVLLIDEAEALDKVYKLHHGEAGEKSSLADQLRDILDSNPQYGIVAVMHLPMSLAWQPLNPNLHTRLTPFAFTGINAEATAALLKSRESHNSFHYTTTACQRVHQLSGGHPLLIRMLGEAIREKGTQGEITSALIDDAFLVALDRAHNNLSTDYYQSTEPHHKSILNKLAENAGRTCYDVHQCMPNAPSILEFNRHLYELVDMGLLISNGDSNVVMPRFCNEFLKAYIRKLLGLEYQLPDP